MPSEEDDKLINFLVTGGHAGSRERNTSLGNIADQQVSTLHSTQNQEEINLLGFVQTYGSLDRGLLRRSRGRKRPELLVAETGGERDRSAPQPQPEDSRTEDPRTKEIKKRVTDWLKDSEEDVTKADEYLDRKKEKKAARGSSSDLKSMCPEVMQLLFVNSLFKHPRC